MAEQIFADGPIDAPAKYVVPGSSEIVPLAVQALLDGTNASGDFLPTLIFRSQAGHVIARVPSSATVAAGGSAEVSWFPGVKNAAAASAGLTQIWWFGAVGQSDGGPQVIPSGVWTQIAFFQATGPAFGSGNLVEFDFVTGAVRFNFDAGLGNMRFVRLSGLWPAGTGAAQLGLRFTASGSVDYRLQDKLSAAQYEPVTNTVGPSGYSELSTYVTPYIFSAAGDHSDMTAWAFQASGVSLALDGVQVEVYGPETANGQA